MVIKLYSHPRSTHGKIVSMVLYEKEIPFEFIKVDFASRQQKAPEYLALFDQAAALEASNFDHYGSPLAFEAVVKKRLNLEPDPAMYKELSDNLNATLDVYDQILAKQEYIAGNSLTLADLYHISVAVLLSYGDIDITRGRANVKRWLDEISGRPSWQKAREGLDT